MEASIRRGRESDLPALRDILNHYILHTVVTFEMVELSLENRRTWFTQFSESGRYQLFVAEKKDVVVGYAASLRFHQRPAYAPSVMTSIYLHPDHTGQGIGERVYSELLENLRETEGRSPGLRTGGFTQSGLGKTPRKTRFSGCGFAQRGWIQVWQIPRCADVRTPPGEVTQSVIKSTADS